MIKKFLYLEWKSFTRSASFATNLGIKILMVFGAIYFAICFLAMGVGAYYIIKKEFNLDPLLAVNQFLVYYLALDFMMRSLWQKIPVMNIKPMLAMNVKSNTIVNFALGQTAFSFFNWMHALFFVPFSIVLLIEGYIPVGVVLWHIGMAAMIYLSNFLNVYLSNKDNVFNIFLAIVVVLAGCQYYQIFDITNYTIHFFQGMYGTIWVFIIPVLATIGLYKITFDFFKSSLYLDEGLKSKKDIATTENLTFLNQFGTLGTFLKNDIKMIKRNKRSRTTIFMSVMFLFYGLLFFSGGIPMYDNPTMHIFAAVFISGGFLLTFGQFVPSWDSAYYPLMMTQNIPYKQYLQSKWWLMVIGTVLATILASFYLYFGVHTYLMIIVGAIFNIGVNSHLVLWGGAYTKTPIDLASTKGAFGDKKAFNLKTLLISLPQLLLPMALYGLGVLIKDANLGLILIALTGVLGFALRNKVFLLIEKTYRTEKYKTLEAYKQVL